jgi:cadmium resistance protein CadD (predicted permease)
MLTVAAVTFSNGGDNIGIYIPLFAKYSSAGEVVLITLIFMLMTAIWCIIAYYLVRHPFMQNVFIRQDISYFLLCLLDLGFTSFWKLETEL